MNDEAPLSDEEIREVRRIIKAEQHMAWLRSSLRVWATYTSAAVLTALALYKGLSEYVAIRVGLK